MRLHYPSKIKFDQTILNHTVLYIYYQVLLFILALLMAMHQRTMIFFNKKTITMNNDDYSMST